MVPRSILTTLPPSGTRHINIHSLYTADYKPSTSVKLEPEETKEVYIAEDESKCQRRRPVRKASKKMLQDHNPELVCT